jgi:DNA-binding NarL/FixJ family response regulator
VTPTILVVDDHAGFRAFTRTLLGNDGFAVIGEAADGAEAIEAVLRHRPDVVLLDVQLPGIDGFEVAEEIAGMASPPAVVMTSTRDAADYGTRLRSAPVRGFVSKQDLSGAALSAVLAARKGALLSPNQR